MRPPVLNKRRDKIPAGARYVGRPTVFGNPFKIGRDGDRDEVIRKYAIYFRDRIFRDHEFRMSLEELRQATALVCWCAPEACHADVIADFLGKNR